MATAIFVYRQDQTFNYRAFAKHLITCPNVLWEQGPGRMCPRPRLRRAVEIELGVSEEEAKKVVEVMTELAFIEVLANNYVNVVGQLLREK